MAELLDTQNERTARSGLGRRSRRGTWIVGTAGALVLLALACTTDVYPTSPEVGWDNFNNIIPLLKIIDPVASQALAQGESFLITWTDSDPDSAAKISFDLIGTQSGVVFPIAGSISENDEIDTWTASIDALPAGEYNLRGRITDGSTTTEVFAELDQPDGGRVSVSITPPEGTPTNRAPQFKVVEPMFNLPISHGDVLVVSIQPIDFEPDLLDPGCVDPAEIHYDPDSEVEVQVFLDYDNSATNDEPFTTGPYELIFLTSETIAQCASGIIQFDAVIDEDKVPVRPDGSPYWIRVIIADGVNPPVSEYADGTINVVK